MQTEKINRTSGRIAMILSAIALLTVLTGYMQPPQPDEGATAHIFQITIVLLLPALMVFLATVDWQRPLRSLRSLTFSIVMLGLAFGALYYLDHYYCRVQH